MQLFWRIAKKQISKNSVIPLSCQNKVKILKKDSLTLKRTKVHMIRRVKNSFFNVAKIIIPKLLLSWFTTINLRTQKKLCKFETSWGSWTLGKTYSNNLNQWSNQFWGQSLKIKLIHKLQRHICFDQKYLSQKVILKILFKLLKNHKRLCKRLW